MQLALGILVMALGILVIRYGDKRVGKSSKEGGVILKLFSHSYSHAKS